MNELDTRPEKLAWLSAGIAVLAGVCALVLARASNGTALTPACIALTALFLISLVSGGRLRFSRKEAEERVQVDEYKTRHTTEELFAEADDAFQVVARANRAYVRYFVPVFAVLLGSALILTALLFWRSWNEALVFPRSQDPLRHVVLVGTLFLGLIVAGSYAVGISRERGYRWLRPVGAWMFLSALLLLVAVVVLVAESFGLGGEILDVRLAMFSMGVLIVLGAEQVINVVIEFYRPRVSHEAERPLYESKLLALFTEPGGLARNVASTLDYQFGFHVSEAWFYRVLERGVIPFLIVMMVAFWLLTSIVVVQSEENGIRERFGAVTDRTPLPPGLYLKLPWPMERIYRFPVQQVQWIPIGYTPSDGEDMPSPEEDALQGDPSGRVILWSRRHSKDEMVFVVASRPLETDESAEDGKADSGSLPVNVYFMSASIPLYFKVNDLYAYHFGHRESQVLVSGDGAHGGGRQSENLQGPLKTLEAIATREVVRYLAHVDFFDILTRGRAEGGEELRNRIQAAVNERGLGVEIVFVGLQGLHPPVVVGRDFDEVVAAMEEKHQTVLEAERYAIQTKLSAETAAVSTVADAQAYKEDRIRVPQAEAARFVEQLVAYRSAPELYRLRTFLDMLETEAQTARKFLLATGQNAEVLILDLQEKLRPDLLDLNTEKKEEE